MAYDIIYRGNIREFENHLLYSAEQELTQKGRMGIWCKLADRYTRQLSIIEENPYPPELDYAGSDDDNPPSIKHMTTKVSFDNIYRWGIPGGATGNHRILFAIHNYSKVVLLHYFDKKYNGDIKKRDILPAENQYEDYCFIDPNYY